MYKKKFLSIGTFNDYVQFKQVKNQNFYESREIGLKDINKSIILLMSWETIVGCIDTNKMIFYHFGKGYSRTTSKQLTMYINSFIASFTHIEYLPKSYTWDKFKKEYLERA